MSSSYLVEFFLVLSLLCWSFSISYCPLVYFLQNMDMHGVITIFTLLTFARLLLTCRVLVQLKGHSVVTRLGQEGSLAKV